MVFIIAYIMLKLCRWIWWNCSSKCFCQWKKHSHFSPIHFNL